MNESGSRPANPRPSPRPVTAWLARTARTVPTAGTAEALDHEAYLLLHETGWWMTANTLTAAGRGLGGMAQCRWRCEQPGGRESWRQWLRVYWNIEGINPNGH